MKCQNHSAPVGNHTPPHPVSCDPLQQRCCGEGGKQIVNGQAVKDKILTPPHAPCVLCGSDAVEEEKRVTAGQVVERQETLEDAEVKNNQS